MKMLHTPPKWADRFLEWYCSERFLEEVQGDLHEQFHLMCDEKGPHKARRWYVIQVFRFFRWFRIKRLHEIPHPLIHPVMFPNYLKTTYRTLLRNKVFSLINILGLAIGMAACLLILRYVSFEMSYDGFHDNSKTLHRVYSDYYRKGTYLGKSVLTGYALGPLLKERIPEIENISRFHPSYVGRVFEYQRSATSKVQFFEEDFPWVDSTFLTMFSYELIRGNPQKALSDPLSILVSESKARQYFGKEDPMGKTLIIHGGKPKLYKVTGVFKDLPANTHLRFDFLRSMADVLSTRQYQRDNGWGWNNFYTYVQLNPGADTAKALAGMNQIILDQKGEDFAQSNSREIPGLQPVPQIHLNTEFDFEPTPPTNPATISFFVLIALVILIIAWVNYMNLSTAKAMDRAREVGIRKTIGAHRGQLIRQFLFESVLINIVAVGASVLLAWLALPVLSELVGKDLSLTYQDNTLFWLVLVGLFVGGALLSGLYPAFVLSSFRPVSVLKGLSNQVMGGISIRKILVVAQFAASVGLIAGTFAVYRQISFMKTQDLGMSLDQVLVVKGPKVLSKVPNYPQAIETLKTELERYASIDRVASADAIPGGGHNWDTQMYRAGDDPSNSQSGSVVWIDEDFLETYEIKVLAGRPFSKAFGMDGDKIMINETTAERFGLGSPEEAIHKKMILSSDTLQVIAVLKNFGWNSMREELSPFIFAPSRGAANRICMKISAEDLPQTLSVIEQTYANHFPDNPFEYYFQDEFFNRQYQADQQFGSVFGMFAGLAILVACLGLFGLSAFTISRRIREIGIRKILGASLAQLLTLLVKDFVWLILIANVIGIPLAYWGISKWLENYAFRIPLDIWTFVAPGVLILLIALITVSFHTVRAGRANPVEALRYE